MFFVINGIPLYNAYRAVFKRKNVIWRIFVLYIRNMVIIGKKVSVLKQSIKFFLQAGRKNFWHGTQRYKFLRRRFFLKRVRLVRKTQLKFRKRRRRRFPSLKSLQYKKYVPLGAFKRKFYKFPFVSYACELAFR